jgi:hypothetical protein
MTKIIRVSRVSWPTMGLEYGYLFHFKTQEELWDYWTISRAGSIQRGVAEALEASRGNRHVTSADGALAYMRLQVGGSLIDASSVFLDVLHGMKKSLREQGEIFVNSNGAYFSLVEGMIVSGTKEVADYILPTDTPPKVIISRWPEGMHWYARVDGQDVSLDGTNKWFSELAARTAVDEWLKRREAYEHESWRR